MPDSISVIRINKAGNDNAYEWEEWAFESPGGKLIFHWDKEQISDDYLEPNGILAYLSYDSWEEFWKVVKRADEAPEWFKPYMEKK